MAAPERAKESSVTNKMLSTEISTQVRASVRIAASSTSQLRKTTTRRVPSSASGAMR